MEGIEKSTDVFIWFNYRLKNYQVGSGIDFIASGENLNEINDFAPILRFKKEKTHIADKVTKELNQSINNL